MVSAAILGLLIVVAMVLDFGLARLDRQVNKSAADDAVAAGIQGFNKGDGKVYSYKGVCEALEFLKANVRPLSALSYSACATPSNLGKVCKDSDPTTHASYTSPLTNGFVVTISRLTHFPIPVLGGQPRQPQRRHRRSLQSVGGHHPAAAEAWPRKPGGQQAARDRYQVSGPGCPQVGRPSTGLAAPGPHSLPGPSGRGRRLWCGIQHSRQGRQRVPSGSC